MENIIYIRSYETPPIDRNEILRYAGAGKDFCELDSLIGECIEEVLDKLVYRVCYCEMPIEKFIKHNSKDLEKNLRDCTSVVLFCATIGIELDRLIARYKSVSPLKSLLFQAIGAERIESLCNLFNDEIRKEKKLIKKSTRPRFSAGYGDFLIEAQKDIFKILEPSRKIGVTLNESLMMSPSKSVSAIIGISDTEHCEDENACEKCNKQDCEYRRKNENT